MRFNSLRLVLALVAAVIVGVTAYYLMPKPLPELTRAEFMAELRAGHVRKIEIEDQDVIIGKSSTRGEFRTGFNGREDVDLPAELRNLGVEVAVSRQRQRAGAIRRQNYSLRCTISCCLRTAWPAALRAMSARGSNREDGNSPFIRELP
jgi:hypothetical protein